MDPEWLHPNDHRGLGIVFNHHDLNHVPRAQSGFTGPGKIGPYERPEFWPLVQIVTEKSTAEIWKLPHPILLSKKKIARNAPSAKFHLKFSYWARSSYFHRWKMFRYFSSRRRIRNRGQKRWNFHLDVVRQSSSRVQSGYDLHPILFCSMHSWGIRAKQVRGCSPPKNKY